jgi:hypothetical protein
VCSWTIYNNQGTRIHQQSSNATMDSDLHHLKHTEMDHFEVRHRMSQVCESPNVMMGRGVVRPHVVP